MIGIVVVLVIVLVLIAGVGYASLKGSTSVNTTGSLSSAVATTSSSLSSKLVNSGTLVVFCTSCSGNNPSNYQWSGSIDNSATSATYDGNGTQTYMLQRGSNTIWIVSWAIQKSTIGGTLELKFTLDNGTTVFDQNTTLPATE